MYVQLKFLHAIAYKRYKTRGRAQLKILPNEASVCHENIIAKNILLWNNGNHDQDRLSKFTDARFKVVVENSSSWKLWKMKAHERLSWIFSEG